MIECQKIGRFLRIFQLWIFILLLQPSHLHAQAQFNVHVENDVFVWKDREYTHGLELTILKASQIADKDEYKAWEFGVGQELYTPVNQQVSTLLPNERPYAGYLFASGYKHHRIEDKHFTWGGQIGILGEKSYGQEFQDITHDLTGFSKRKGWDNQLKNELLISLEAEARKIMRVSHNIEFIPYAIGRFGNKQVDSILGAQIRLGPTLPHDFGIVNLKSVGNPIHVAGDRGRTIYFFADLSTHFVAHNVFLDGNVFRDSLSSVDKRNNVNQIQLGIAYLAEQFRLSYSHTWQTKEYDTQIKSHTFGSMALAYLY